MSKDSKSLETLRHSTEHVLTQAMINLYGKKLKMAMGPATDDGFYFDFDYPEKISAADFKKIETAMHKIIAQDLPFKKQVLSVAKAKKLFKGNEYKQEWLDEIKARKEKVTIYHTGDKFTDICTGPHLKSTGEIKVFKLLSVAGAYWRGSEKNKMLTRIYGTAFYSQKELKQHLLLLQKAKKIDHRKLGKQLDLFIFDDQVGPGLPLWLPKGALLRHKIMEFAFNTYLSKGYEPVSTPHIASEALWKHSGHLDFYQDSMYGPLGIDQQKYRLKPMNCPFHVAIYNSRPRSYKQLPLRWTEMGTVYRYEKTGVLHGLARVRGFTQDDAHIICTPDQLHQELVSALKLTLFILKTFGFKKFEMNLSTRDPKDKNKFAGTDKGWTMAQTALKKALTAIDYKNYILDVGGAVFYGPKIDIKVADSIGRKWQLSTIQFDFNLAQRLNMTYIAKDGKEKQPFMIHRALLGSFERFIGILIEHYAGAFPVWLSPVQVSLIPISDKQLTYAKKIKQDLEEKNIRVELDDRAESMQAKIRDAEMQKTPYLLILGEKEAKAKSVSVRQRSKGNLGTMPLPKFISQITKQVEEKTID